MQKIICSSHTGICPKTGDRKTIGIEFFEVQMAGTLTPGYKRRSMNCSESASCPYYDDKLGCPLYCEAVAP